VRRTLAAIAVVASVAIAGPSKLGPYAQYALYAQQEEPASPRARAPVTILQINDVYSTVPVDGAGGLARVATIKQRLKDAGRTPFLVLAGDFLSPSVASSVFKGEQMVAALNAAGLDLATLGNHEFDFGDDLLIQRMKEAKWQWVVSNVIDRRTGKPIGDAAPYLLRDFGGLKVGFIGLCLTTAEISRTNLTHTRLDDPIATAARYVPLLKRRGAQVVVAITHLAYADDRKLVERVPQIDLVIGGHEHFPITTTDRGALVSKGGSDAKWVARIDVNVARSRGTDGSRGAGGAGGAGTVERFFELIPVTADIPEDQHTAEVVKTYEDRLGVELDVVVAQSEAPLDAESVRLRASEQPIGNLFADAMRAELQADIGIMNAGSIRGDRVYPAGPLTRRTIISMHPFGNVICKIEVAGSVILQALNSAVSKLPAAAGQFPQVSGLTMSVDVNAAPGSRVRDVNVNGKPLDPTGRYTLAIPDYLLKGGDNYTMFTDEKVLVGPEAGPLLVNALEHYLAAKRVVAPKVEGRITIVR